MRAVVCVTVFVVATTCEVDMIDGCVVVIVVNGGILVSVVGLVFLVVVTIVVELIEVLVTLVVVTEVRVDVDDVVVTVDVVLLTVGDGDGEGEEGADVGGAGPMGPQVVN